MYTEEHSSIQYLPCGVYEQSVSAASHDVYSHLLSRLDQFIVSHRSEQPLYLLQDASDLNLAYTPRVRLFIEATITSLQQKRKPICLALVLPTSAGSCTDFLNCLTRQREMPHIRYMCFNNRVEALAWLEKFQHRVSQPAVQGI